LFTDHRNLVYIFNPLSIDQSLARHTVAKLQRWALKLSVFKYTIEHISGELNLRADILSRWGAGYKKKEVSASVLMGTMFVITPQMKTTEATLPRLEDFLLAQKKAIKKLSREAPATQGQHGLRVYDDGAVWIPSTDIDIQLRMCVSAHCDSAGHRRKSATLANMEPHVRWPTMAIDVQQFLEKCLLCKATESGECKPVPFAEAQHSDKPGEIVDYFHAWKS
jgi:Integrase zinc binding domain